MNGFDSGTGFGYDQITPNMNLDDYDAPYMSLPTGRPNRTMETPRVAPRDPVASYYDTSRRPYHSPDSSLIGGSCDSQGGGIPGRIGKLLDCGCGCRGGQKVATLKSAKENFLSGNVELDNIHMFFIFLLAVIMIMNAMNVKKLTKQIKILARAAVQKSGAAAPGPTT